MFQRLEKATEIQFTFEGDRYFAKQGDTIAAALLAAGVSTFRSSFVSHQPRAPYCMMGVCFECLVNIDGKANQQACLVPVENGMTVSIVRTE